MSTPDTGRALLATAGKNLPALLEEALNNRGMSQATLARFSHVSRAAVNQAVKGKRIPGEQVIKVWDAVLGTGGSLATQAALDRAARGRSSGRRGRPRVSVPHQLPAPPVRLFGRHREAISVRSELITNGVPVVVIAGGVGAGSSSLACTIAAQVRPAFPDGLLYAQGHGHTPGRGPAAAADILAGWLAALGVRAIPQGFSDRAELFRRLLRNRRLLIMIDDVASGAQVRSLLPGDSPSVMLVTTRHRLSSLAVNANARTYTLTPLAGEDAREMLISRIEAPQDTGMDRVSQNRVLDVCSGLPRAIAAAAELINTRGWQRTVKLLEAQPLAALDAAIHDDPTSSLARGYQACWNCLTTSAQDMLITLATGENRRAGITVHDAAAEAVQDELVREHLVSVEGSMSPLLRAWIRQHTTRTGQANHNDAA